MRPAARVLGALMLLLLSYLPWGSQVCAQEKAPEVVYTGSVFDAVQFISAFYPAERDTLYLLADTENALTLRSTLVYFWETTGEYVADWETQNELLEGDLEILRGSEVVLKTGLVPTVLVRQREETQVRGLLFGDEATARYQRNLDDIRRYQAEYQDYSDASQQYSDELWARFQHPEEYADADPLVEPVPPEPVQEYVTQPAPGYRVSLPAGDYRLRVMDGDGNVVQGSEKALRVFSHRRTGIGYVAYTDHRWTDQKVSREVNDVIYVGEAASLFLRPFAQVEFYADDYWNLKEPQKVHDPLDSWMWVDLGPYDGGHLCVERADGALAEAYRQPFYVEQVEGKNLGYRIVDVDPYDPEARASFEAFKVDLAAGAPKTIRLVEGGDALTGSQRWVRALTPTSPFLMAMPALAVLVAGGLLAYWRRRTTRL